MLVGTQAEVTDRCRRLRYIDAGYLVFHFKIIVLLSEHIYIIFFYIFFSFDEFSLLYNCP